MFTLSAVNTALAYDEVTLYQESEVTLELIPSGQLNHTKLTVDQTENNLGLTSGIIGTIVIFGTFYVFKRNEQAKTASLRTE